MLQRITLRTWYLGVFIACIGLLAFALYAQHQMFLDPCPLCIFQRVAFMWIGAWALLAALHNPAGTKMRLFYAVQLLIGAIAGAATAARHMWLQGLPPDEVPDCGPGLSYMMETLPVMDWFTAVLAGDGSCADIKWSFLGLSMPAWTLVWYLGFGLLTIVIVMLKLRTAETKP